MIWLDKVGKQSLFNCFPCDSTRIFLAIGITEPSGSFICENCVEIVKDERRLCVCNSKVTIYRCDSIVDFLVVLCAIVFLRLLGFKLHGDLS